MEYYNLYAAWIGILLGFLSGALQGLFFHHEHWRGGYASWSRRMLRLGHISFFGLAGVNLAYAVSARVFVEARGGAWPAALFIIGAATMPLICYGAAFWKPLRRLFLIPVLALIGGAILFIFGGLFS